MNSTFETEYKAVRETSAAAGILEFPLRGLIEVSGSEAIQFLNGLITNDVKALPENSWMFAAFPNAQGRLLALVRVLRLGNKFLFDIDAANHSQILQNLMRFTFAGDFQVNDLSKNFALVALQGKAAQELTEKVFNAAPQQNEIAALKFQNQMVLVIQGVYAAPNGFDFFLPQELAAALIAEFETHGAIKIGDETSEVLRVEMGTPVYGLDMDETTIVLETGLDEAVSFTKGCYIGQEIIARIHFRGHVAKKIAGLVLAENQEIAANDPLKSLAGKAAGRITSTVFSPALNKRIALALVRYEFLTPETELLVIHGENQFKANVVALPFLN